MGGLKFGIFRGPREGNDIAYVAHPCYEQDKSFKSKTETTVRYRTVSSRIEEPIHFFNGNVHFFHSPDQLIQVFLSL